MLEERTFDQLKKKLLARRRELIEQRSAMRLSWQTMSQAEIEMEESASNENTVRHLERFVHRGQEEIVKIDEALTRIENGEYGICASCGDSISYKRLEALPWARECLDCAEQRELFPGRAPLSIAEQIEEDELNDSEIINAIWTAIENDDRIEKEGLDISYSDGVIHLSGTLPRQEQRQFVLEIIHDEIGIDDIIDRVDIGESAYEEQTDTDEKEDIEPEEKERVLEGERGQDDTHVSISENESYTPPDHFVPENEG